MAKCLQIQFTVGVKIFWVMLGLEISLRCQKAKYHSLRVCLSSYISYHFGLVAEGHVTVLLLVSGESSVLMAAEPKPR